MRARFNIHRLRARVATAILAMMMMAGSLVLVAPASALSKHVLSTSFAGAGPVTLTNPSDIAFDPTSGDVYVADTPDNNRQSIEVEATGGSFTLTFKGQTTAPIFRAGFGLALQIEEALEALPAIGSDNVQAFSINDAVAVIFEGELADTEQPQLTADSSGLTGGAAAVHIATVIHGAAAADVKKFTPAGDFLFIVGKNVNKSKIEDPGSSDAEKNLCTAASGDVCQPGTPGSGPGAFNGFFAGIQNSTQPFSNIFIRTDRHRLYLAVDEGSGDLYVGDPADGVVTKLDPQGNLVSAWGKVGQLDGSGAGPNGPFKLLNTNFLTIDGIGVRPDGTLLVQAHSFLFRFHPDGTYLDSEQAGFASDAIDTFGDALAPGTRERYHIERRFIEEPMVVEHFPSSVTIVDKPGEQNVPSGPPFETFGSGELNIPQGVALDPATGMVYVADSGNRRVAVFNAVPYLPDAIPVSNGLTPHSEELGGEVERAGAGPITGCHFEYGQSAAYGSGPVPCATNPPSSLPYAESTTQVRAEAAGLEFATSYHYHLVAENAAGESDSFDDTFTTLPLPPVIESVTGQAFAETAVIRSRIHPGGGPTTFRVEYVDQHTFETDGDFGHAQSTPELSAGTARTAQQFFSHLTGLDSDTTYRYRLVATNASSPPGGTIGAEHSFTTLPYVAEPAEPCANAHVRQQTSSAQLLDCRAYELVSASDAAGYDVESDLTPGQMPFGGYPYADGRVLYGVHSGGIPGTNHPTNRGIDPYVASRGVDGWSTEYVGVPANNPFAAEPFSSGPTSASASLEAFAFGGPGGCTPCFEGGYTGIPLHLPSGEIAQGMVSSGVPAPGSSFKSDGHVAKELSADGSHFIFGSTWRFAPGGNSSTGDVSIYDRNLSTGVTNVVSNAPGGGPLVCLQGTGKCSSADGDAGGIAELDVSRNGSRIVIGQKVSEDTDHNTYYHLYMDIGDSPNTVDLTPGAPDGALYDGMNEDGTKVFFTTKDALTTGSQDSDASPDIFMMDLSNSASPALSRISIGEGTGNTDLCDPAANSSHEHWNSVELEGPNCGVVAVGGGGGISSANGSIYFLSPELLEGGRGTQDAPNLYVARLSDGYAPHFVATLESIFTGPNPPKLLRSFDHNFGSFVGASGLAVDDASGDLYVLDDETGTVSRFDSSGNAAPFSASGSYITGNKLIGTPGAPFGEAYGYGANQIAVDQTTGNLYVPNLFSGTVEVFSSTGQYLAAKQITGVEFADGIALDSSTGDIYVTSYFGEVHVFDPSGAPLSSFPVVFPGGSVAVDSGTGNVFVTSRPEEGPSETAVYEPSGALIKKLDTKSGLGVAADPAGPGVFVDATSEIIHYDSSGNRLDSFGSGHLSKSIALALGPDGRVFATNGNGTEIAVFTASLAPGPAIDNPLVLHSVNAAATRHTADFQTTPDGGFAAFPSTLSLPGIGAETAGQTVLYRYDATAQHLACIACTLSGFPSTGDSSLASNGLSLADDGRVFFNSDDALLAADTDERRDVYEWEPAGIGNCEQSSPTFVGGSCLGLVSAGTSTFDSGLLSATANASDAHFFTRDSLVRQDENGPTMKIYDARADGGFPYEFRPVTCRASDECHGAASPVPPPLEVGAESNPTKFQKGAGCKKGFVRKQHRCVRKPNHAHHHRRHAHHHGGKK